MEIIQRQYTSRQTTQSLIGRRFQLRMEILRHFYENDSRSFNDQTLDFEITFVTLGSLRKYFQSVIVASKIHNYSLQELKYQLNFLVDKKYLCTCGTDCNNETRYYFEHEGRNFFEMNYSAIGYNLDFQEDLFAHNEEVSRRHK